MRKGRAKWLLGPIVGIGLTIVIGGAVEVSAQPATAAARDVEAVRGVLQKVISTINDAAFQRAPRDRRMEMLRPFYRGDTTYAKDDLPMFFGPLTEPASRGVDAYLDNLNLNLEWVLGQGMTYGVRIDEMQVEVSSRLAVVLALTTSGYASADGKTNYATRGRASIVMNKMPNGQWQITHEHTELFNPQNPNAPTKEKLTADIRKLKPR